MNAITALHNYRAGAAWAERRGDTARARACRAAADDLAKRLAPPIILPDNQDDVLAQRWDAEIMAEHAYCRTSHSYEVVRRQAEFAHRLDFIARQRAQA